MTISVWLGCSRVQRRFVILSIPRHWSRGRTFQRVMITSSRTCRAMSVKLSMISKSRGSCGQTFGLRVRSLLQDITHGDPCIWVLLELEGVSLSSASWWQGWAYFGESLLGLFLLDVIVSYIDRARVSPQGLERGPRYKVKAVQALTTSPLPSKKARTVLSSSCTDTDMPPQRLAKSPSARKLSTTTPQHADRGGGKEAKREDRQEVD